MAYECKIINTDAIKGLSVLRHDCGNNIKQFYMYLNSIAKDYSSTHVNPKEDFAKKYKEKYGKDVDFINDNPNDIFDAVTEYYKSKGLSVEKNTNYVSEEKDIVSTLFYTSVEAREDAKNYIADAIRDINYSCFILMPRKNPVKFLEQYLLNRKEIARQLIRESSISFDNKSMALAELKYANSIPEVTKILKKHNLDANINPNARSKVYFKKTLKAQIGREVRRRMSIVSGESVDSLKNRFKEMTENDMRELLGGNDISKENRNYLSMYWELVCDKDNKLLDEITEELFGEIDFYNSKSQDQQDEDTRTEEETAQDEFLDQIQDAEDNEQSVVAAYDHTGLVNDALSLIDPTVKAHLASIKQLNSTALIDGNPDYDRNNSLGVPHGIDVHKAYGYLYHQVSYDNIESMIRSIRIIAEAYPGMESFSMLADELEADENLANLYWNNFAKIVISKTITSSSPEENKAYISNNDCDILTTLSNRFVNSSKHAAYTIIDNKSYISLMNTLIGAAKDKNYIAAILTEEGAAEKANFIKGITLLVKAYYPCIEEASIKAFINMRKDEYGRLDVGRNAQILLRIIEKTITAADDTRKRRETGLNKLDVAKFFNRKLDSLIDWLYKAQSSSPNKATKEQIELHLASLTTEQAQTYINSKLAPSLAKIYNNFYSYKRIDIEDNVESEDYSTKELTLTALDLARLMLEYSPISVELNSTNAKRNQVSSVINSSYLTNMINILKDENLLKKFGKERSKSAQYNLSNIMYEHSNPDRTIGTYGLFKKVNGELVPTSYATQLLSIHLFDGAVDEVSGKAALYYEMTKGDYTATAFINFFDTKVDRERIPMAGYFMRIPSDAKNNMVVRAPRYNTQMLYSIRNDKEVTNIINQRLASIPTVDIQTINKINPQPITVDREIIVDYITSVKKNKVKELRVDYKLLKNHKSGDTVYVELETDPNDDDPNAIKRESGTRFVVEGVISKGKLTNVTFVGLSSNLTDDIAFKLNKVIFNALDKSGRVYREYNNNHTVFNALKRSFKQEILDMAIAIDSIFETYSEEEDPNRVGLIKRDENGEPIYKPGHSNVGNDNPGCYANYHFSANDGVIAKKENELWKLTGNVFKSNRFTYIDRTTGKEINLGNELVEKYLNPLYGGSNGKWIRTIRRNGDIVDVDLSSLDEAINEMIGKFITEYVHDAMEQLSIYEGNLGGTPIDFEHVAEFVLNQRIVHTEYDDLFEGNTKLYKSGQDSFKRTKEVQGGGIPFGMTDFTTLFDRKYAEIPSVLDTDLFKHWGVRQHNQFRSITVRNTKKTGETIGTFKLDSKGDPIAFDKIGSLSQSLIDYYTKEGFDDKTAKDKAFEIMKRYYNPKVNDAQSYITFDEFIRRAARKGQLYKYKDLIDKIKRGEDLIADELEAFIQVQKNFYYDQHYDEDAHCFVSRQIKNSEFVLVPQLIKGTELEVVAKFMEKHGIDQLNTEETSKAGKSCIIEVFDKNTGKVKEDILEEIENGGPISKAGNAVLNKKARQYYNYEFLFSQQETPQHAHSKNKAGVQIMKKIVDNIDENSPLWEVKQKFIEYYTTNIIESSKEYFKQFGVDITKQGSFDFDNSKLDKFYEIYFREIKARKSDSNLLDFAKLEESDIEGLEPQTVLPDFLTLMSKTLEQIAQNMINRHIVRQQLPGFHGPQVTSVGFIERTINDIGGGKVTSKYDDKLGFYRDGNPYIEIIVSPSFFGFERKKADGTLKTKQELLDELKAANADTFIGYRVPTEAKYSVAVMKVVDFVDDAYGTTIVVPNDWVAQTGSDFDVEGSIFDVDSIFGITRHTKLDKQGKLTEIEENLKSKQGRDNGILNCMLKIMQHPSTLEERLLTSNVEHITDAIKDPNIIDPRISNAKKNRSQYDILDQIENHEDAISGQQLKAISVMWDGLISIANSVGFYLSNDYKIEVVKDGKTHVLTQFGDDSEHNHRNYEGHLLTAYSAETSPYEFDAIKSGAIPNVNKYTFPVFKFLSGMGVDYKTNLAFMTTPAIDRIIKINDKYNSIYSSYSPNVINAAIKEIAEELDIDTRGLNRDDIIKAIEDKTNTVFNQYKDNKKIVLNTSTIKEHKTNGTLLTELQDILTFEQLKNLADLFTNISMILRGDKISAKKSIYETEDILDKCLELAHNNTVVTKEGTNIIDAIFPGLIGRLALEKSTQLYLDLDGFMADNRIKDSKYKVLYAFMRYATVPSTILNKKLFSTQNSNFTDLVKYVAKFNKGYTRLRPDTREKLIKYAISKIYDTVLLEQSDDNTEIPQGYTAFDERKRIYGYQTTLTHLDIIDLHNPKDNELEEFKRLSPAEQVVFLQEKTTDDDNIFKLLEVELNPYKRKGHRIRYTDTSNDINHARKLFAQAFYNDNPFIAIAARNLFKYAFIVEGNTLTRHGISNIVSGPKNRCIKEYVGAFRSAFNTLINENSILDIGLDFARAYTDDLYIPTHYVDRGINGREELSKIGAIIAIPNTEYNEKLIEKYNIDKNSLVKLKFSKDKQHVLYRVREISNSTGSMYVLYPINRLDPFEHGEVSANPKNRVYSTSVYYEKIITELVNNFELVNTANVANAIQRVKPEAKQTDVVDKRVNRSNTPFDINNPSEDIYEASNTIIKRIRETFNGAVTPNTKFYGIYPSLDKYIRNSGILNGEPQVVTMTDENGEEKEVTVVISRLPIGDRNKIANLVKKGNRLSEENSPYAAAVNWILDNTGIKFLIDNVYVVTPPVTLSEETMTAIRKQQEEAANANFYLWSYNRRRNTLSCSYLSG